MFEDWSDQPNQPLFSVEPNGGWKSARVPRPLGPNPPRDHYMAWLKARAEDNDFKRLHTYLFGLRYICWLVIAPACLAWVVSGGESSIDTRHRSVLFLAVGYIGLMATYVFEQCVYRSVWYCREVSIELATERMSQLTADELGGELDD